MNVITTLALTALLTQVPPPPPAFKASASPVSDALRNLAARYSKNLIRSAELMPTRARRRRRS